MTKEGLQLGAVLSLTDLINALGEHSEQQGYSYFTELADYLIKAGSTPVRNVSTHRLTMLLYCSFYQTVFCIAFLLIV